MGVAGDECGIHLAGKITKRKGLGQYKKHEECNLDEMMSQQRYY